MHRRKSQPLQHIRRVVITLVVFGIAVGAIAACESFAESSRPQSQDTEAHIAQAVAATVEAQSRIEQTVTATVTPTRPTPTTKFIRVTVNPATGTPPATPIGWRPPTPQEITDLKQLMLDLTNAERAKHGAPLVKLGNNSSPQIHAEQGLANCYSAHWDLWGFKPLYRYALSGGDQYAAENGWGVDYCPKASDNYRINLPTLWADEVRETVAWWISSPDHHPTLIDPRHTVMHAGIAIGKYGNSNMVQVFSGDYVTWTDRPSIRGCVTNGFKQVAGV